MLKYKNKLYVGNYAQVKTNIMEVVHSSAEGGHSGSLNTYKRAKSHFYWPGIKKEIKEFMSSCDIC